MKPAAFGRLCVETYAIRSFESFFSQPPSGGCVLKPALHKRPFLELLQPPSGGCVLKLLRHPQNLGIAVSAAFGRLCVETVVTSVKAGDPDSRLRAAVC